jgi:hypothetical protein
MGKKKVVWAVVDNNTSKALPSAKAVVAKFDTLKEAHAFVGSTSGKEDWSIRQVNPTGRRRKDDEDE